MEQKKKVGAGFGVMLLRDNKILLGKRHDDPEKADSELNGEGTWTMPGGKFEFGETFEEGGTREVMEETGIKLYPIKIGFPKNGFIPTRGCNPLLQVKQTFLNKNKNLKPNFIEYK